MTGKIDRKTKERLLNALARFHENEEKLARKREERIWREITSPCRLSDLLARLTKDELSNIRSNLNLKGMSTLNKKELAEELVRLLPEKTEEVFSGFDEERYQLVKKMCEKGGFIFDSDISTEKAEYLRENGIIFPGSRNGRKILCMPLEFLDIFRDMINPEYGKLVRRNTEWVRLTHGLLYYYGYLSFIQLQDTIGKLTGEKPDAVQYLKILMDAMFYHGQIWPDGAGFCDIRVSDAQKVQQEQRARPDVAYRPFTREQLFKAGAPGYIDLTPTLRVFMEFLRENYEISKEEVNEIADECLYIINSDGKPGDLLKHLESFLEFPSFEFVQELTEVMMHLFNNTRMWILKGHTPSELSKEEKKHLKPLSEAPLIKNGPVSNVIDIQTRTIVGRNDPCPCGSGKKFKKCCGR